MDKRRTTMKRLLPHKWVLTIGSVVLLAVDTTAFGGTPWWGTPPDPFRTEGVIRKDTPGLNDPTGHDCAVPGGALTFPAAVTLALCRNPATRAAWITAHQQAAALGIAESAWLPSVVVTGQEEREFGGQHADINGDIVSTDQTTRDASATLTWTLWDFGGRTGRIQNAHSILDADAYTASRTVQTTVGTVVQAYYGVVADDELSALAKLMEETTKHTLDIAKALANGGVGSLGDVLQAQTAYQQAVLTRVQAEATAINARGTLAVTLGLTADEAFRLAADPVPKDVPPLSARMADLMAQAALQRPDLKAAQAQVTAAEANVTVARAAGLPSISVGAIHTFAATTGVPNENYNTVGITVTVPIFTGFNVSYNVRQAQAALQGQQMSLEQVGLGVTSDVWIGYYTLDSANQQLTVTADLVKTADDNLRVALGRYQGGVGSILDVLTAQQAEATAHQMQIAAQLGWREARAQFALALGRLSSAEPLKDDVAIP
jgi:outer membrane protein